MFYVISNLVWLMFQAVAKIIYNTMGNSSVVISNLVGPVEKMALANHPINGFYFTMTGGPEVSISIINFFFFSHLCKFNFLLYLLMLLFIYTIYPCFAVTWDFLGNNAFWMSNEFHSNSLFRVLVNTVPFVCGCRM